MFAFTNIPYLSSCRGGGRSSGCRGRSSSSSGRRCSRSCLEGEININNSNFHIL